MAVADRVFARMNGDTVTCTARFDDVTGQMTDILIDNQGARGTVTIRFLDPTTKAIIWEGTRNAGTGLRTWNIPQNSPLDATWGPNPKTGITGWYFPFVITTSWG